MDRAVVEQHVNNILTKYGDYLKMQAKSDRSIELYKFNFEKIDLKYPTSVYPDDYCIANTYKRLYIFPRFFSRFVYIVSSKHNYELFDYFILNTEVGDMEEEDAINFLRDWDYDYLDYQSDSIISGDKSKCPLILYEPMYTRIKFKHDIRDVDIIIANYSVYIFYDSAYFYNLILAKKDKGMFETGELEIRLELTDYDTDTDSDIDDKEDELCDDNGGEDDEF